MVEGHRFLFDRRFLHDTSWKGSKKFCERFLGLGLGQPCSAGSRCCPLFMRDSSFLIGSYLKGLTRFYKNIFVGLCEKLSAM